MSLMSKMSAFSGEEDSSPLKYQRQRANPPKPAPTAAKNAKPVKRGPKVLLASSIRCLYKLVDGNFSAMADGNPLACVIMQKDEHSSLVLYSLDATKKQYLQLLISHYSTMTPSQGYYVSIVDSANDETFSICCTTIEQRMEILWAFNMARFGALRNMEDGLDKELLAPQCVMEDQTETQAFDVAHSNVRAIGREFLPGSAEVKRDGPTLFDMMIKGTEVMLEGSYINVGASYVSLLPPNERCEELAVTEDKWIAVEICSIEYTPPTETEMENPEEVPISENKEVEKEEIVENGEQKEEKHENIEDGDDDEEDETMFEPPAERRQSLLQRMAKLSSAGSYGQGVQGSNLIAAVTGKLADNNEDSSEEEDTSSDDDGILAATPFEEQQTKENLFTAASPAVKPRLFSDSSIEPVDQSTLNNLPISTKSSIVEEKNTNPKEHQQSEKEINKKKSGRRMSVRKTRSRRSSKALMSPLIPPQPATTSTTAASIQIPQSPLLAPSAPITTTVAHQTQDNVGVMMLHSTLLSMVDTLSKHTQSLEKLEANKSTSVETPVIPTRPSVDVDVDADLKPMVLADRLNDILNQNQKLSNERSKLQTCLSQALERGHTHLEAHSKIMEEHSQCLEKFKSFESNIERVEEERDELKKEFVEFKEQVAGMTEENASLQSIIISASAEQDKMKSEKKLLEKQIEELKSAASTPQVNVTECDNEKKDLEAQVTTLKEQNETLKGKIVETEQKAAETLSQTRKQFRQQSDERLQQMKTQFRREVDVMMKKREAKLRDEYEKQISALKEELKKQ
eukprot:TRINITY_DN3436_c0_g3_i1.p1 TRINITY_DN3436_c0_g3~~TRINITY_DN3436_c0_g3_i1.p1  ORF type:complete len:797 (-),score=278.56 TRINITY_DN3436_c0_g3_i1:142-2532(-)